MFGYKRLAGSDIDAQLPIGAKFGRSAGGTRKIITMGSLLLSGRQSLLLGKVKHSESDSKFSFGIRVIFR